ncbi:MAG: ABC transporter substrate-binding protein [Burkholderiales bacterium]|nr:ABC transporter substrate-binding protein [Burkholderiales bacterium]
MIGTTSKLIRVLLLSACVGALEVQFAEAQAQSRPTISVGLVLKSAYAWPLFVARHKKFFEDQGLTVDISTTGSAAKSVQQITAGGINIGEAGQTDFARAINMGAPLKIVASEMETLPYSLIAGKEFRVISDLKRKTIVVGGPKDVTRYTAAVIFWANGLNEGDYDLIYSGSSSNRLAAVLNGTAAAAVLGQPFDFVAVARGMNNLESAYRLIPQFSFAGYAVESGWAEKNRTNLVKLLKADLTAVHWLYDVGNKAEAITILMKETGANQQDVTNTYEMYITKLQVYAKDGRVSQPGFQKALEALASLGDLGTPFPPYEKFIDNSYINAAQ